MPHRVKGKSKERGLMLIIIGFSIAAVGGWLQYFNGGSLGVAVSCTLFALGNTILVLGGK